MTRAPLPFRVGDLTLLQGRLAEVRELLPSGMVRVVFVASPWAWALVPAASLEWLGFGETARGAA